MIGEVEDPCTQTLERLKEYYVEFKGMIRRKENESQSPGFNDIVKFLVRYEKYFEFQSCTTPLELAIQKYHPDVVNILLDYRASMHLPGYKSSLLHLAIWCGKDRTEIVEVLLHNGHKVDVIDLYDRTPLQYCIYHELRNVAKLLMKYGANANSKDGLENGNSLLHLAILRKSYDILELLLINGACANVINNDFDTPLAIAIRRNLSEKFLKLLILFGADTSYKFPNGLSLLHDAIKRRCFVAIKNLISNGLSLNIRDFKGQNALEYALKKDFSISKILIYKK